MRIISTPHKHTKISIAFPVPRLLTEIVPRFIFLLSVTLSQRSITMVEGWLCRRQRIPGALVEVISVVRGAEISGKRPGFKSDFFMQFPDSTIEYSGHLG